MARTVKALTLHQPWASLITIGAKRWETRSWLTRFRGVLVIHASRSFEFRHLASVEPFLSALLSAELEPDQLPVGAVVGSAHVAGCFPVEDVRDLITGDENRFGDFSAGRFAWSLSFALRLPSALPTSGRQRLWNWSAPAGWDDDAIKAPMVVEGGSRWLEML